MDNTKFNTNAPDAMHWVMAFLNQYGFRVKRPDNWAALVNQIVYPGTTARTPVPLGPYVYVKDLMQLANAVGQGDRSTWDAIADVITEEQRKELEPEIWRFLKFATMMHQADQSAGPTPH